jgi:hypothetical protein
MLALASLQQLAVRLDLQAIMLEVLAIHLQMEHTHLAVVVAAQLT